MPHDADVAPYAFIFTCLSCRWEQLGHAGRTSKCAPVECPLPSAANGRLTQWQFISPAPRSLPLTYGDSVRVECQPGARVGGRYLSFPAAQTATCSDDCSVSALSACVRLQCPDVSSPPNSVLLISHRGTVFEALAADASNAPDRLLHNESITVRCRPGFMRGPAALAQADTPGPAPGQSARCATSFDVRCHMAEWQFNQQTCSPQVCGCGFALPCPPFAGDPHAAHARPSQGAAHSSSVNVTCKAGFRAVAVPVADSAEVMAGSSHAAVAAPTCGAAAWYRARCNDCAYNRTQRCAPVACPLATAHASLVGLGAHGAAARLVLAESAVLRCDEGFRPSTAHAVGTPLTPIQQQSMSRDAAVTCAGNCSLVPSVTCEPLVCVWAEQAHLFPNSSELVGRNYSHGETLLVQCRPGFYLQGSATCATFYFARCHDGLFQGGPPCVAITSDTCGCGAGSCPAFQRAISEASTHGPAAHGAAVQVQCAAGFRAVDAARTTSSCSDARGMTATCQDCSWVRSKACRPVTCANSSNTSAAFAEATAGSRVQVECARGLRAGSSHPGASASFEAVCRDDCELQPSPQTHCQRVACPQLQRVADSSLSAAMAMAHGDQVNVTCLPGFQVDGNGSGVAPCAREFTMRCDDGILLNNSFRCAAMRCGCGSASCPAWTDSGALSILPSGALSHAQHSLVTCKAGWRAGAPASPSAHTTAASCAAPARYNVTCDDCSLAAPMRCQRTSCGTWQARASGNSSVSGVLPEAELEASSGQAAVLSGDSITLSCPRGFRLGSRLAAVTATQRIDCSETCTFSSVPPNAACLRVSCGAHAAPASGVLGVSFFNASTDGPWQNASLAPGLNASEPTKMRFGDVMEIKCAPGYMSSASSAQAGAVPCATSFNATCSDSGLVEGATTTCIPRVCGCGSTQACSAASLTVTTATTLDPSTLPAVPVPANASVVLGCRQGFRWVAGSEPASPVACSASSTHQQRFRCNDCALTPVQVGQCVPVKCPAYTSADPFVHSWAPVPGGSSGAATPSQTPYGLELEVQCKVGYRAESSASCSDSLCTAETARSFRVTCGASCAYTPGRRCLPVTCGGLSFLKNAAFETLLAAQPVMGALQRVCAVSSACVFATSARVLRLQCMYENLCMYMYVCMHTGPALLSGWGQSKRHLQRGLSSTATAAYLRWCCHQ